LVGKPSARSPQTISPFSEIRKTTGNPLGTLGMRDFSTERIALYIELLTGCDGPQPLLEGRRLLDLSDVKEWIALRLQSELHYEPSIDTSRKD